MISCFLFTSSFSICMMCTLTTTLRFHYYCLPINFSNFHFIYNLSCCIGSSSLCSYTFFSMALHRQLLAYCPVYTTLTSYIILRFSSPISITYFNHKPCSINFCIPFFITPSIFSLFPLFHGLSICTSQFYNKSLCLSFHTLILKS